MTREEGELIPGMARIVYLHPEEEEEEEDDDYLNTQTKIIAFTAQPSLNGKR